MASDLDQIPSLQGGEFRSLHRGSLWWRQQERPDIAFGAHSLIGQIHQAVTLTWMLANRTTGPAANERQAFTLATIARVSGATGTQIPLEQFQGLYGAPSAPCFLGNAPKPAISAGYAASAGAKQRCTGNGANVLIIRLNERPGRWSPMTATLRSNGERSIAGYLPQRPNVARRIRPLSNARFQPDTPG